MWDCACAPRTDTVLLQVRGIQSDCVYKFLQKCRHAKGSAPRTHRSYACPPGAHPCWLLSRQQGYLVGVRQSSVIENISRGSAKIEVAMGSVTANRGMLISVCVACTRGWAPKASFGGAGGLFGLAEAVLILIGGLIGVFVGEAFNHQFFIDEHGLSLPDVRQRAAVTVLSALAGIVFEPDLGSVHEFGGSPGCFASEALDSFPGSADFRGVDADEADAG